MGSLKSFTLFLGGLTRLSLLGGMGESLPHWPKIYLLLLQEKSPSRLTPNFYPSYSLHMQVMLIVISINVQYLQNVVFSFEKGSSGQNYSLPDSHHPIEKPTWQISHPPTLNTIWKIMGKRPSL